ncbi:hypothetical protein OB919_08605 [Halobacteria archaeon AArc-curdl1]|uniref:HEAT repeat domain-containing protein n=1 Tax=Natronosalvus hydrolyticus TaxID=2979988 RepID=A0AAP2Z851_9EURY|nr:hypothetical protein [Halobacteria archaeon AArc-curdl1]
MGGEGTDTRAGTDESLELGRLLAQLSTDEVERHAPAVETIRERVETEPSMCLPTVPKLRSLLGESTTAVDQDIAYCLAHLAAEAPNDVAPSVPDVVSFVVENPATPAREDLLACLTAVGEERPELVMKHLERVTLENEAVTLEGGVDGSVTERVDAESVTVADVHEQVLATLEQR